jgi:hypothetical protein
MDYLSLHTWHSGQVFRLDLALNLLLFTPLIVLHYHSTSYLLECVFITRFPHIGPVVLFVLGTSVEFCLAYYQASLPHGQHGGPGGQLARRFYTFVLTVANVSHLKSVECLYVGLTSCTLGSAIRTALTGILILWGMRAGRNILCTPFSLSIDRQAEPHHYTFTTLFNIKPDGSQVSAIDVAVTILIVHTCIHVHWTGVGAFLDLLLFPSRPGLSSLCSLALGYALYIAIIYYWLPLWKAISRQFEQESEMKQVAWENFCTLVMGFAVISIWRGIWLWFDLLSTKFPIYFMLHDVTPLVGCLASYLLIMMARLTNSLPYKGCEIDGELKGGLGLQCSIGYFSYFISHINHSDNEKMDDNTETNTYGTDATQNVSTSETDSPEENSMRRRRVRAIEHAKNISKDSNAVNGSLNYNITLSEEEIWRSSNQDR